jgi:hypothetical protein
VDLTRIGANRSGRQISKHLEIACFWMDTSYYWLNSANKLKVGWDNAPHHTQVESFPHHKHVGKQGDLQFSRETNLDEVMGVILKVN